MDRPPTRILPSSYQPEFIPIKTGPSFKHNRVAPPVPIDYHGYAQPYQSYESSLSKMSAYPRGQPSYRQPPMNSNYPHQPYYPQNDSLRTDEEPGGNVEPESWFAKPLCLGLTRLSAGILFGTMIILAIASIAGLITSTVLYIQDVNTDSQWKILGMVVCAIMLLTVLVTFCIFIYCYKKGRIINDNNNKTDVFTPSYQQESDYRHYRSPIAYGRAGNFSSTFNDDEIVEVDDKLTNTEMTNAPLRPRDIQRGVWPGKNAYNGLAHRPIEPPQMTHRVIQALPHEIDQIPVSKQRQPVLDIGPQTIIRLPNNRRDHDRGKQPRHLNETEPPYEMVEEVIRKPRRRDTDEYVEIVQLPKKGKHKSRFTKVSVKHIRNNEEPEDIDENHNTNHFYQ